MSVQLKKLGQALLTTALSTIYQVPASPVNIIGEIKEIILCNTGTVPLSIEIHAVPNGTTPGPLTTLFKQDVYVGRETKLTGLSTVMNSTDMLQALCSAGATVSMYVSGLERS